MSYTMHDWFDDVLGPKLIEYYKKRKKKTESEENDSSKSNCDEFLDMLRLSLSQKESDSFVAILLEILVNPDNEEMEIDDKVLEFFNKIVHYNNYELSKLEYRKNSRVIKKVDYKLPDESEE